MRIYTYLGIVVVTLSLLLSCGPTPGQDGGEPYESTPDGELLDILFVDAVCEAIWSCYSDNAELAEASQEDVGRYDTLSSCKSDPDTIIDAGVDAEEIERAVEEGRLVIDRSYARDCRDAIRDQICSGRFDAQDPEACLNTFDGQIAEGGACLHELECAGALGCEQSSDPDICYGECVEREQSGSTCGGEVCGVDEYCEPQYDEETGGLSEQCAPRVGEGEECMDHDECQQGLSCDWDSEQCESLDTAGLGEECSYFDTYCEPGTRCLPTKIDEATETADGTCEPIGADGDRCFTGWDCKQKHDCDETLDDEPYLGKCVELYAAQNGDECSSNDHCESRYCDSDDEVCVTRELLEDGEPCNSGTECKSGTCNLDTFVCETPERFEDGEPCSTNNECESGYCHYDAEEGSSVCSQPQVCEVPED